MPANLIQKIEDALNNKSFTDGLSAYTQANCQVTITDDKLYRIYRPANLTPSTDGNTMWGGLVLKPMAAGIMTIEKGHRYEIKFDVKGKTSNNVHDISWSNNVGWSGGGLTPYPSNVIANSIPSEWQSDDWFTFFYQFTVNDDVYKVCTSSYSSFVEGNTYLSYNGFKFGFGYSSTGTLGTELYLRNFRMYDITTKPDNIKFKKEGIIITDFITESAGFASIKESNEYYTNEIIEI